MKGSCLLALFALVFFLPVFSPTDAHGADPPPLAFFWGGPGNAFGSFNSPLAITVGSSGDVYVVDYQDRRTQKFTRDGHFIQAWGAYTREIASSPNGNLIYLTPGGWIDADLAIFSPQGQYVGGTRFNLILSERWRFAG